MKKVGMKYGLICGLVYIIYGMAAILLSSDPQKNQLLSSLAGLVMMVATFFVIFYGVKEYRTSEENFVKKGGALTIGEAVKLGTLIALIGSLLAAAFSLLYSYVIDPGYMDRMMEAMRESYEESGMTDEQIEQAVKYVNMFRNPLLGAAFTIIWYSIWGLVKGLISGAILKREPAPTV